MKTDILGLPIEVMDEPDTACAGAAVLAGLGAGIFGSAEEAAGRLVAVGRRFQPRPEFRAVYAAKQALYEQTYLATSGLRPLRQAVEDEIARLASTMGKSN